ncbi:interleukin-22 [Synchiropus picturatus]
MKVSAATLASLLRSGAMALLLLLLIGWHAPATASSVNKPLSKVLHSPQTYKAVRNVSQEGQKAQKHDDTSSRLYPKTPTGRDHFQICCLHANILDFYQHNILRHRDDKQQHIQRLKIDFEAISQDLQAHGCNVTRYHDHHHAVEFRKKLDKLPGEAGINKALGEIDILFSYLQDFCVHPKNSTAIAAAQ